MARYTLRVPIQVGGKEVKELTLRRPRAYDFEVLDEIEGINKRKVRLIANCAGLAPDEASQLDAYDYHQLSDMVGDFFTKEPSAQTVAS